MGHACSKPAAVASMAPTPRAPHQAKPGKVDEEQAHTEDHNMPPPVLTSPPVEPTAEPLQDTPAAAAAPAVEAAATPEPVETAPLAPLLQPATDEEVLQVTKEPSETKEAPVASVTSSKLPPVRGAVTSAVVQDGDGAAGEPADHDPKTTAAAADEGSELHASAPEHSTAAEPEAAAEEAEEAEEKRVEADEAREHVHMHAVEAAA